MPDVRPNESEADYVARCIPIVMGEGADSGAQAAAICHGKYRAHKEAKSEDERLRTKP